MNNNIYINDLGILNSQAEGKEAVLKSILSGQRNAFSIVNIHDKDYHVAKYKNFDSEQLKLFGNDRLIFLIQKACQQIKNTVDEMKNKFGTARIGVVFGSTDNGSETTLNALKQFQKKSTFPEDYTIDKQQAHYPAQFIKNYFGLKSYCAAISTACTSSAGAIIRGKKLLEADLLDAVIVGGADIVSESVLKGFISLEAVDSQPSNPFSKNRHGINLGEGAALLVLSKLRPKENSIVIAGAGESSDAYHNTAPDPEGIGAIKAMQKALEQAQISSVDYINLHGTGTTLNDSMEIKATSKVMGENTWASTTKTMIGHTLGSAGSMEAGISYLLLSDLNKDNALPPQLWDGEYEDNSPKIKFTPKNLSEIKINSCMTNNYAFGGSNISLIICKNSGDLK